MATTTAEAIRDRIITVIAALTPTSHAGTGFRPYRNEGDADFETWCAANQAQAFRRFQVRDTGRDGAPDVSNTDVEQRTVQYTLTVAYPQNNRTGKGAALDRDDVMRVDRLQIEKAIGMLGHANFTDPYPSATWRFEDWDVSRSSGANMDFTVVTVGYQYYLQVGAVVPANVAPTAGFTSSVANLTVTFTDTSTDSDGTVSAWAWDFGDGATSTVQNPSHTYATAGAYTVTLTVTDDDGATDVATAEVTAVAPALHKRLVVLLGQSNTTGYGVAADVTNYPGIADPYPNVQYIEQSSILVNPPTWTTDGPRDLSPRTVEVASHVAGTFGPELSMGRALDEAGGAEWFIAKMGIDTSGLENNWNNPAWPSSGGALKTQFMTFVAAQMAAFDAELAAFVVVNGETDAGESPDAANFKTNMDSFFGDVRTTLGVPACPVIINRLSSNYAVLQSGTVRSNQESFVNTDANAGIVYVDDLLFRDTVHFTDDAYVTLGLRLAAKVLEVIDGAAAPANPTWKGAGIPVFATSAQTLTPTWPAHEAGDIGLMVLGGIGLNTYALSVPAGFVAVPDSPQWDSGTNSNARLQVWWCRASSSAMASPTISDVASDDAKMATIIVIKGAAASGDPWDVTAGDALGTASTSVTFPGETTTVDNTLIVNILAYKLDVLGAQVSGWTNAGLTDLTEHFDNSTATGGGCGLAIATGVKATAGAFAGTTATLATTSTQARMTIAIKP